MTILAAYMEGARYGHAVNYVVKIDGIDALFSEHESAGSAPSGYTLDQGALVIDGSAAIGSEIDRKRGIGKALSLSFQLRPTATVEALLTEPGKFAQLTADLAYNGTTLTVDSSTGWGASDEVHIGHEYLGTVLSTTATTLVLGTRPATYDIDGRSYAWSSDSTTGQLVTNGPYYWRGRRVALYASHLDPYAANHDADVLTSAACVWRGRIHVPPVVSSDGLWSFEALALDRELTLPVATVASGKGEFRADTDPLVEINPETVVRIRYECLSDTGTGYQQVAPSADRITIAITPFSGTNPETGTAFALGDLVRASTARAAFTAAWVAQLGGMTFPGGSRFASDVDLTNFAWASNYNSDTWGGDTSAWSWFAGMVEVVNNSTSADVKVSHWTPEIANSLTTASIADYDNPLASSGALRAFYAGMAAADEVEIAQDPSAGSTPGHAPQYTGIQQLINITGAGSIVVTLDGTSDAAALPSSGVAIIESEGETVFYFYTDLSEVDEGGKVTLRLRPGYGPGIDGLVTRWQAGEISDVSVTFGFLLAEGTPADNMRTVLQSSGRGDNGTFDTQSEGFGYDIAAVNEDTFDAALSGPTWLGLEQSLHLDGEASFADLFGGFLALSGRAVVSRPTDDWSDVQLSAVYSGVGGTEAYKVEITDSDLAWTSKRRPPVRPRESYASPNTVDITLKNSVKTKAGTVLARDHDSRRQLGPETWGVKVHGFARDDIEKRITAWTFALFKLGQHSQLVEVDVVPWLGDEEEGIRVGDTVRLNISHESIRTRSTGAKGYDGLARVLGWRFNLRDYSTRLLLLIDGLNATIPLCPGAQVVTWSTTPTQPGIGDTIDVDAAFIRVMAEVRDASRDGSNPFRLILYKPGDAWAGEAYTISTVTETGGVCRLTIASLINSPTISTSHYLTFPETGNANTAQLRYMHEDSSKGWS